jgi:hypothetical protein
MKKAASLVVVALMAGSVWAAAMAAPLRAPIAAQGSDTKVDEISCGTGVTDRQIQGKATEFTGVDLVNCLTVISSKSTPTTIKHVWYRNGNNVGAISLDIGGSPWRTWSNHPVQPGSWKVEVQDAGGAVVSTTEFTVK